MNTSVNAYLYCVGGKAVPQWEDALVPNNLYETVNHSTEMDVHTTKMWKTGTLRLRKDWKWKWTAVNQRHVTMCLKSNNQKGQVKHGKKDRTYCNFGKDLIKLHICISAADTCSVISECVINSDTPEIYWFNQLLISVFIGINLHKLAKYKISLKMNISNTITKLNMGTIRAYNKHNVVVLRVKWKNKGWGRWQLGIKPSEQYEEALRRNI